MRTVDWLTIIAIVIGPLVAVQLTRWLDQKKEIRERKLDIFKTLMATRAYTISPAHVEALNRIDLEFLASSKRDKPVVDAWKAYLDLLGNRQIPPEQWGIRRVDLLVDLLHAMGKALDYDFDKTNIKNATYSPTAHGRIETEQEQLRQSAIKLLSGETPLQVSIRETTDRDAQQTIAASRDT
jgi:hypothetical protein